MTTTVRAWTHPSFRLLYFDDPLAPRSTDALRYVAAHVNIPIAAGEMLARFPHRGHTVAGHFKDDGSVAH